MKAARLLWVLVLAVMALPAMAQVDIGFAPRLVKALVDDNQLHAPAVNPLQPTISPVPKEDEKPISQLPDDSNFKFLYVGNLTQSGDGFVFRAEDGVTFKVRGYLVNCDRAFGDKRTQVVTLIGNVHIESADFTLTRAGAVTVDFLQGTYTAYDGAAVLSPKLVQGALTDNLYTKARESSSDANKVITTIFGDLTTCNYPAPHYDIEADRSTLIPGKRIIFRKTRIRVLGHTLVTLPFLSLPLDSRTYRNLPYVGESPDEGYFIKWLYGVPLKNPHYNLDTRVDYMTRLGLGLGVDYSYVNHNSAGIGSIYHITGPGNDWIISNQHRQIFPWGTVKFDIDYEENNYLINPDGTTLNTKLEVALPQGTHGTDTFTITDQLSNSFGYTTDNFTWSWEDQRNWDAKTTSTIDVDYSQNGSTFSGAGTGTSGGNTSQRIDVHIQAQRDLNQAVGSIEYLQNIPIGSSPANQFIGTADETPVLTLASDSGKLFGQTFGKDYPFKTSISWGEFEDESGNPIEREFFDFSFNHTDTSHTRFHIDYNGEFQQGIYSDDLAQYTLIGGTNIRYDLGTDTGINLRYNYERPYGYSPVAIDQTGQTNYISADINVRPIQPFLVGLQTGYDLVRLEEHMAAWQELSLRTEYTPIKNMMLRGLFTYDTMNTVWEDAQLDFSYFPGSYRMTVGADYDGPSHTLSSINAYIDALKIGRMTVSTALAWNGYLNHFDTEQFSFDYDLHCVDAILELQQNNSGFRPGTQVYFFVRIKALPFDVPFGVGTRGQAVGFNNGASF